MMTAMTSPPWGDFRSTDEPPLATEQPSARVDAFRDSMARLAGGVGLLTTRDPVGRDCGITVTAVSSVSLEPPLVLVSVKREGFIHDALYVSDGWALTMLSDDQVDLAKYAARDRHPGDRDDFSPWSSRDGQIVDAVVVTGGVAAIECVPYKLVDAGDHTVVIGRVVATASDMQGRHPLIHVDRAYRTVGQPPPE
jgi:flavin reductase (DIM6/NTAB) family NADH-FMN oxidoreductase RutF